MAYTRKTFDLYVSAEMIEVLKKIENNSTVAKMLLKNRHKVESLVDNPVNYISISSDDPTKISYLSKDRIDKFFSGEWNKEEIFTSSRRFMIKPGSFISKLFKDVCPKEVEKFASLYKNIQSTNKIGTFKVISGEKIRYYYHHVNYVDSKASSLGKSCMKHDHLQDNFTLYETNPNQVKMLVLLDDNAKLIGRALLWETSTKVMDRIYTIDDDKYAWEFKRWADKNGYSYKKEQKHNNTLSFTSNGESSQLKLQINLENCDISLFPYMDTFKFIDKKNKTLYNYIPSGVTVQTLIQTSGIPLAGDFLGLDDLTNLYERSDDLVFLDYLKIRTSKSNCEYSSIYGKHILKVGAKYIPEMDDYIHQDDSLNTPSVRRIVERISSNKSEDLVSFA